MILSLAVIILFLLHCIYHRVVLRRRRREFSASGFVTNSVFQPVREAYESSCWRHEAGSGGGSSLAVFHRGQLVVNVWSGLTNARQKVPWTRHTLANVYSSANSLAAMCLARLSAQGYIDYAQPVAKYWPEFAANDKSAITVGQLMSQTAGLAGLDDPINATDLAIGQSQEGVNAVLANQKPLWPPEEGKVREFHHWTLGLYADALIQRVDPKGRRLADYFREEIAEPFGISVRIGQGSEISLYARPVPNWGLVWSCLTNPIYWLSLRRLLRSLLLAQIPHRLSGTMTRLRQLATNACQGAFWCQVDLPCVAGGAVGTAEAFARLFALLTAGKIVSDSSIVRRLAEPVAELPELNYHCGCQVAIGLGTCPLRLQNSLGSSWLLGSVGYGGQFLYCDLQRQLSVAFVTNSLSPMSWGDDPRCRGLLTAATNCCDRLAYD